MARPRVKPVESEVPFSALRVLFATGLLLFWDLLMDYTVSRRWLSLSNPQIYFLPPFLAGAWLGIFERWRGISYGLLGCLLFLLVEHTFDGIYHRPTLGEDAFQYDTSSLLGVIVGALFGSATVMALRRDKAVGPIPRPTGKALLVVMGVLVFCTGLLEWSVRIAPPGRPHLLFSMPNSYALMGAGVILVVVALLADKLGIE